MIAPLFRQRLTQSAPERPGRPGPRWLAHVAPLALLATLTLWAAWPLWPALSTRIEDLGDPLLNAWILAWDHYALFHQLTDFFQANTFWPHASSLAYGEPMLTQALLALPFRPLFDHPVALHNLSMMQGIFLSGAAAYALGFHYFRNIGAATVCALAYGPAAYRINQSVHLQLIHGEFLPLMILAIERLLDGGGRRWRWLLGAAALGQWLSSWYWTVFSFWCVVPFLIARLIKCGMRNAECGMKNEGIQNSESRIQNELTTHHAPRTTTNSPLATRRSPLIPHSAFRIPHLMLPLLLAAALAAPVAWPTLQLKLKGFIVRPVDQTVHFAARPADFFTPGRRSLLYAGLGLERRLVGTGAERALFPGFIVLVGFLTSLAFSIKKNPHPQSAIRSPQSNPASSERSAASAQSGQSQISNLKSQIAGICSSFIVHRSSFLPRPSPLSFPLRLWLLITLLLLAFTAGYSITFNFFGASRTIPLPLALIKWFPMADQMRVPARWMLPALLGIALLAACAWDRLARARFRRARPLAAAAFLLLIAETLTRPVAFSTVPAAPPAAIQWLNRQPWTAPVFFIPPAYERVMLEAAWLRQSLLNGTNGYFPPAHQGVLKSFANDFPDPGATRGLRSLGIRFVVINTAEAARASLYWNPARLPRLLAALPPEFPRHQLDPYLVIDLGQPETDMGRIDTYYDVFTLKLLELYRRSK